MTHNEALVLLNKIKEEGVEENVFGTMSAETEENLFVIIFLKNKVDKFYLGEWRYL